MENLPPAIHGATLGTAIAVVFVAAAIHGALGYGFGLIAAPVLVMLDPALVPVPLLGISIPLMAVTGWRDRAALERCEIFYALAGRMPGTALGVGAVPVASQATLAVAFALAVLAGVGLSLSHVWLRPTARGLAAAGLVSGLMGTVTSVGTPPLALVYQHRSTTDVRAALSTLTAIGAAISLAALAAAGHASRADAILVALLCPAVVAGYSAAGLLRRMVDGREPQPALLVFATLSALSILANQIW
ncbi:MAG: TSUP family transporter [Actinomycetota bacterium]